MNISNVVAWGSHRADRWRDCQLDLKQSRASQPYHYSPLGWKIVCFGISPCIVGYLAASMDSTYWRPGTPPPRCDILECFQTLLTVSWGKGKNHPWLRTASVGDSVIFQLFMKYLLMLTNIMGWDFSKY